MAFKIAFSLLALAVISHGFPYPQGAYSDGQNNEWRYSNRGAYGPSPGAPRYDGFGLHHSEHDRFRPNAIAPEGFDSLELNVPHSFGPGQTNPCIPRSGDDQQAPERYGPRPIGPHRYDLHYGPREFPSNHFGPEFARPHYFARKYFSQDYSRPNHFVNGHARHIDFGHFRPGGFESDLPRRAGYDYGTFPEDVPFGNHHHHQLPRQLGRY